MSFFLGEEACILMTFVRPSSTFCYFFLFLLDPFYEWKNYYFPNFHVAISLFIEHTVRSSPRDQSFLCVLHESLNGSYSARTKSWIWNGLETSLKSQSLGALVGLLCSFTFNICWRTLLNLWCFISNKLFIKVLANALSELTNYFSIAFMYPQWD